MARRINFWMPLYVGDYLMDTRHLRAIEHGAYMLLIMHYWTDGPLEDDDDFLARIACTTPDEWASISTRVRAFFKAKGGRLYHSRIEHEQKNIEKIRKNRSENGKNGAKSRWGKAKQNQSDEYQAHSEANGSAIANGWQTDSYPHPHPQESTKTSSSESGTPAREASAEPVHFSPSLSDPTHRWAGLGTHQELDRDGKSRPVVGSYFLEGACRSVCEAAGINDANFRGDWRPIIAWMKDGLDLHEIILPAIRHVAERSGYHASNIRSFQYFDKAVREWRRAA